MVILKVKKLLLILTIGFSAGFSANSLAIPTTNPDTILQDSYNEAMRAADALAQLTALQEQLAQAKEQYDQAAEQFDQTIELTTEGMTFEELLNSDIYKSYMPTNIQDMVNTGNDINDISSEMIEDLGDLADDPFSNKSKDTFIAEKMAASGRTGDISILEENYLTAVLLEKQKDLEIKRQRYLYLDELKKANELSQAKIEDLQSQLSVATTPADKQNLTAALIAEGNLIQLRQLDYERSIEQLELTATIANDTNKNKKAEALQKLDADRAAITAFDPDAILNYGSN